MRVAIIGASAKADRYSNQAQRLLLEYHHEVVLIAPQQQEILGLHTQPELPSQGIDTVTLYARPAIWQHYIEQIIACGAGRVICNPGTEDAALQQQLEHAGIRVVNACTLVLLRTGQFERA